MRDPSHPNTSKSGKFVLRLPEWLHADLSQKAIQDGCSLNQLCESILSGRNLSTQYWDWIIDRVHQKLGTKLIGVILFGSQARGTARDTSDTDLLFVIDQSMQVTRSLLRELDDLCDNSKISIHLSHLPSNLCHLGSLWLEISIDGKILWDQKQLTHTTLTHIRREISAGNYKRELVHGHSYWKRNHYAK